MGSLGERNLLLLGVVLGRRSIWGLSQVGKTKVCFGLKLLFVMLLRWLFVREFWLALKVIENLLILFEFLLLVVFIDATDHYRAPLRRKFRFLVNLWREHVLLLVIDFFCKQLGHFSGLFHRVFWWLFVWWTKSFFFLPAFVDCGGERCQVYDDLFFVADGLIFEWIAHELFKFFVHLHLKLLKFRYSLSLWLILRLFHIILRSRFARWLWSKFVGLNLVSILWLNIKFGFNLVSNFPLILLILGVELIDDTIALLLPPREHISIANNLLCHYGSISGQRVLKVQLLLQSLIV